MGVRTRRWHVLAGVVTAVVLVAGAVFVWPDGPDGPPPAAKAARPKPVLKPLRLAPKPLWTSQGLELDPSPSAVDVFGGTMLIQQGGLRIAAVDMSNGTVRYTLTMGADLTGRGGTWRGATVPVDNAGLIMKWSSQADCGTDGLCEPSEAHRDGLALVSASDGRTVWETTVLPPYPATDVDTRPDMYVEVVTDDVVLVSVGTDGLSEDHQKPPLRTLAIDARTGATLWESQDPLWPKAVAGDTVVGTVPAPDSTEWTVVGADLRTGRRTWTRPGGLDQSSVEQVVGDVALLRGKTGPASTPDRLVFVDTATGRTITELRHPENFIEYDDPEGATSCGHDGGTLIVCAGRDETSDADAVAADDDVVAIFRVDSRKLATELVDYGSLHVIDAWHGRAVLSGRLNGDPAPQMFTVDSGGNVIDKDLRLPGRLEELTADRATFITSRGVEVYEVLR